MTEQVMGVVSAEVDPDTHEFAPTGTLGAETSGDSLQRRQVRWVLRGATGKERFIGESPKTLAERVNEAYRDDYLEAEEQEFLELTREHFSRLDDE